MKKEEKGIVLDYLREGYPRSYKKEPIVQAIGTKNFTLLELVPKEGVNISLEEEVYVGEEEREKIQYIKKTLEYKELTTTAKNELENTVDALIEKNEERFVEFFNKSGAITIREHSLQLLPGIGKKHMRKILDEREKKEFESFEDIKERVDLMPDPKGVLKERVLEELRSNTKYTLFIPQKRKKKRRRR